MKRIWGWLWHWLITDDPGCELSQLDQWDGISNNRTEFYE